MARHVRHSAHAEPDSLDCPRADKLMRSTVIPIERAKPGGEAADSQPSPPTLDAFLQSVEKRAFRTALFTTRNDADAFDIVQDAMIQLVQHYRIKPAAEWPLLFQRILQNRIMDWHRQQSLRRRWFWQPSARDDDSDEDVLETVADSRDINPAAMLQRARDIDMAIAVIEKLPLRQRQAFLLRAWEGLDVADTANAMQCSEGAVKSHFFRAMQAIRQTLEQEP